MNGVFIALQELITYHSYSREYYFLEFNCGIILFKCTLWFIKDSFMLGIVQLN